MGVVVVVTVPSPLREVHTRRSQCWCDEISPICANCARRELQCSFLTDNDETTPGNGASQSPAAQGPPPRPRSNPASSTLRAQPPTNHLQTAAPPGLLPATSATVLDPQIQARHMLELELMHHYSTSTYMSFFGLRDHVATVNAWQRFVPREALKYDFLMYGLLAFTALHIAKLTRPADDKLDESTAMDTDADADADADADTDTDGVGGGGSGGGGGEATFSAPSSFYFQKALEYQNEAFRSFRSVLDHVTQDNCNAAFAFSVLTTLLVIAVPGFEDGSEKEDGTSNKTMQAVFTMFEFLKGLSSIVAASGEWFHKGPWAHVLAHFQEFQEGHWELSDPDCLQVLRRLSSLNEELNDPADPAEGSKFRVNKCAIDNLERCFAKYHVPAVVRGGGGGDDVAGVGGGERDVAYKGHILGWLTMAGSDFVTSLHRGDSLALLIFLHWAVLLKNLESFWWSHNSAKALVAEVASMLHPRGSEWEHRTMWAREKVGLP
ncbi:hypothetical protein PV08_01003 [Exophiala spinifera]|uniref:Zn(2)-C6 fungal-type domain-containing protein n=1 Tax=Exophiala spinifera TaxID=91928 RepID=A0A0D2BNB5_9EURO|nr:uncharacterized protein PV08_01003 [Exophiala spinifera]KIW20428.1 hypothetical protein PV08_01003 [Exophiala spinifera]